VMLNSQGIGLITVIAISGCSVMLLVLGRQKLLELKKDCSCLPANLNQEGGLGSHSCEHHQQQRAEGGKSVTWRTKLGKKDYGELCSEGLWESPPTALTGSPPSPDKKRNLVKKVRFSEDVVEPSGDNVAYRRRHTLALKSGQGRPQKPDDICCQHERNNEQVDYSKSSEKQRRVQRNIPANRKALYVGIWNDRSRRALLH